MVELAHARAAGRYVVTSVMIGPQSAAVGHSANMWLQCLAATLLIATGASREVFTNTFLVRFKRSVQHDEAHQLALRHGFDSLGPVSVDHVIIRKHSHRHSYLRQYNLIYVPGKSLCLPNRWNFIATRSFVN